MLNPNSTNYTMQLQYAKCHNLPHVATLMIAMYMKHIAACALSKASSTVVVYVVTSI